MSTTTGPASASPGALETKPPRGTTPGDRLLGGIGAAMVLGAVVLFFVGGESDGAVAPAADLPVLELVQPQHGASVRTAGLDVVFRVEGDFGPKPGGWGTDSLHLHLSLDGREIMPGAADVARLSPGLFQWTLPRPAPGLHTVRLFWSGPDHRPIDGAGSRTVQVIVEG